MSREYSILLIDDHQLMRMAMRSLLLRIPHITNIWEAASLEEGIAVFSDKQADLVFLDLDLPDCTGIATLKRFLESLPDATVALMSADNSEATIRQAMRLGVKGYLCKSLPPEIVLIAVELMLAGGTYVPDAWLVSQTGGRRPPLPLPHGSGEVPPILKFDSPEHLDRLREHLPPRLRAVLDLLLQGSSNRDIAQELNLSHGTVKNYVSDIYDRLDISSRQRTISYAMKLYDGTAPQK